MPQPHVLAICTANLCRSPMMELMLREQLPDLTVTSAGVEATDGRPMDPDTAAVLGERSLADPDFRSRQLQPHHLVGVDLVLTATLAHRSAVVTQRPAALRRTFTLLEFADLVGDLDAPDLGTLVAQAAARRARSTGERDLADPYLQGLEAHREAAGIVAAATETIAAALTAAHRS